MADIEVRIVLQDGKSCIQVEGHARANPVLCGVISAFTQQYAMSLRTLLIGEEDKVTWHIDDPHGILADPYHAIYKHKEGPTIT